MNDNDRVWEIKNIIEDNIWLSDELELAGVKNAAEDLLDYIKEHYVPKEMS